MPDMGKMGECEKNTCCATLLLGCETRDSESVAKLALTGAELSI
jgi:hypothetical protein